METVVAIEDNDEGKHENSVVVDRSSSALSSPNQIANPVVYKLVRVEGDGRLVPATDDEVMKMEDFFEHDNSEMRVVADTGQSLECISIERSSSGKLQLECSKGTADTDLGKLNAKLQYIEQMLQRVKNEEKLRVSCGSPVHSCVNIDSLCSADKFPVMDGKNQSDITSQEIPSVAPSLNYTQSNQYGSNDQCSRPSEVVIESVTSTSALNNDFSMFEGEISLDKLSIRELHELFKVTFSRETTVKDKQWLKRRIAMSLTNSRDFSGTTFIVKDNKIIRKCVDIGGNGSAEAVTMDNVAGEENDNFKVSSTLKGVGVEDNQVVSETGQRSNNMEHELRGDDDQIKERAAKRIRKPTKRYIEELSENEYREYGPKIMGSNKNVGAGISSTSYMRHTLSTTSDNNASSEVRTFVTKLLYLGGFGVQIPCVHRVRRSRPRKDMMTLVKFHPTGMSQTEKLGKKALEDHCSYADNNSEKVLKSRSTPGKCNQTSASEPGKEKQIPAISTNELRQESRPKRADPSTHTSDDTVVTVPNAKGGMRRKHHRPWTLVEVMKLVEGVSRCGAGRWSEIKQLSFSSYSYRTSVDLKDKWRNLLKASFAQTPADDGVYSRKHGAVPIPEPILVRVRELAEMKSQVPQNFSSGKLIASLGNSHEDRSGYL